MKLIIAIALLLHIVEAKEPKSTMWAKCITEQNVMLDCKLVNDKVVINGKTTNYRKLAVGEFYNTVVVLLGNPIKEVQDD